MAYNIRCMSTIQYFCYTDKFILESGEYLPGFRIAYQTLGEPNPEQNNTIWIIHAFSANSNPLDWWPGVVGENCAIDPKKHFIICANCPGSHYGSTSPLSINPETGEPFFHDFPALTHRDVVGMFDALRNHLGIQRIKLLTGPSLGGQQALEWAISNPDIFENLCLVGTNAKHSPWGIAFNESQRMAIEADHTWHQRTASAGLDGMKVARSIALLSYRTAYGYNSTQFEESPKTDRFKASSYQRYQGEKLALRFNAFSYWYLSKMMDSHDVGRGRISIENALQNVKAKTLVVGIESDILFPVEEQQFLANHILNAEFTCFSSPFGHDGFLIENKAMSDVFNRILKQQSVLMRTV